MLNARIHSIETSGFFDGPGIRTVIFFQGCSLRCIYCHNPDTWTSKDGDLYTVTELIDKVRNYKNYYRISNGGVTISGGEPLLQGAFVLSFIRACKEEGIHVALDVSGMIPEGSKNITESIISETDLIILDIKGGTQQKFMEITRCNKFDLPEMVELLNKHKRSVWVRYVAIPGINDAEDDITEVRKFISGINGLEKIEVLPFHQLGQFKYESLGIPYSLKNHPEMSKQSAKAIEKLLMQ